MASITKTFQKLHNYKENEEIKTNLPFSIKAYQDGRYLVTETIKIEFLPEKNNVKHLSYKDIYKYREKKENV